MGLVCVISLKYYRMLDETVVTIVYHLAYAWVSMSEYHVQGDSPISGWLIKDGRVICIVKTLLIIAYTLVFSKTSKNIGFQAEAKYCYFFCRF